MKFWIGVLVASVMFLGGVIYVLDNGLSDMLADMEMNSPELADLAMSPIADGENRADDEPVNHSCLAKLPSDAASKDAVLSVVRAEDDLPSELLEIVGDVEYGEYLASDCMACHLTESEADGIPDISRLGQTDFIVAMHAYKDRLRDDPVMQISVSNLDDEAIAALAAYFAKQ